MRHAKVLPLFLLPIAIVGACSDDALNGTGPIDSGAPDTSTTTDARADTFAFVDSDFLDTNVPTDSQPPVDSGRDSGRDTGTVNDTGTANDTGTTISDAAIDVQVFDGGACHNLANNGPVVAETQVAANPPTPLGGSIQQGLYFFTKWETFTGPGGQTGPTGNTRKTSFYFYPTTYLKTTADNGSVDEHDTRTWQIDPGDNTLLNSGQYCPTVDQLSSYFTAQGNTLVLIIAGGMALTFTHQ